MYICLTSITNFTLLCACLTSDTTLTCHVLHKSHSPLCSPLSSLSSSSPFTLLSPLTLSSPHPHHSHYPHPVLTTHTTLILSSSLTLPSPHPHHSHCPHPILTTHTTLTTLALVLLSSTRKRMCLVQDSRGTYPRLSLTYSNASLRTL